MATICHPGERRKSRARAVARPCVRPPRQPAPGAIGRAVLFVHLVLSPLVFSKDTLEAFEYNKVTLLLLAAAVLGGLGCRRW